MTPLLRVFPRKGESLTPRESECLGLFVQGLDAKAVGCAMEVSHRTVHFHCLHIAEKLGTGNIRESVLVAIRERMFDLRDVGARL